MTASLCPTFFVVPALSLHCSNVLTQLIKDNIHTRHSRTRDRLLHTYLKTSFANYAKYLSLFLQQENTTNQLRYQASYTMLSLNLGLLFIVARALANPIHDARAPHAKRLLGQELQSIESAFWSSYHQSVSLHQTTMSGEHMSSMSICLHGVPQSAYATRSAIEPVLASSTQTAHQPKHIGGNSELDHLHNHVRPDDAPIAGVPEEKGLAYPTHHLSNTDHLHHHDRSEDED